MKRLYTTLLFAIFTLFLSIQATTHTLNQASGIFGVHNSAYVNNMNEVWDINTGVPKAVKFTISQYTEEGFDFVLIYSVDNNGMLNCVYNNYGYQDGTITTVLPTGKARVVFISDESVCNDNGYTGFTASFVVDDSYYISQDLQVTGNSFLNGDVGIGNSNPQFKLDVSGDIQLNGKLGAGLSDQTSYDNKTFGNYSLGWYSDSWTGVGPTLWQSAWGGMKFFTNSLPRFSITNSGNIGLGTTEPSNKLDVAALNGDGIRIGKVGDTGNTNVPIGALSAQYNIDFTGYRNISNNQIGARISALRFNCHVENNALIQKTGLAFYTNPIGINTGTTDLAERMRITPEGFIGIGTNNPQNMLDVKGTIRAIEIKVESVDKFADFVFEKTYKLPKLSEVNSFIQTNGHLPNIPSANEVKENGMSLVEMQVKLLQKVEELTLYSIQQQEEIQLLKSEIQLLKQK